MGRPKKAIKVLIEEIETMNRDSYLFVLGEISLAFKMELISFDERSGLEDKLFNKLREYSNIEIIEGL